MRVQMLRAQVWRAEGHDHSLDRFYLWLLERIDGWDAWSDLVSKGGKRALSEHLMKLAFCDSFANGVVDAHGGG